MALKVKNPPANEGDARDAGSIHGSGRSSGVGNGNPLQYSCLENSMDREAWWATSPWGCKELDMTERLHFGLQSILFLILEILFGIEHYPMFIVGT